MDDRNGRKNNPNDPDDYSDNSESDIEYTDTPLSESLRIEQVQPVEDEVDTDDKEDEAEEGGQNQAPPAANADNGPTPSFGLPLLVIFLVGLGGCVLVIGLHIGHGRTLSHLQSFREVIEKARPLADQLPLAQAELLILEKTAETTSPTAELEDCHVKKVSLEAKVEHGKTCKKSLHHERSKKEKLSAETKLCTEQLAGSEACEKRLQNTLERMDLTDSNLTACTLSRQLKADENLEEAKHCAAACNKEIADLNSTINHRKPELEGVDRCSAQLPKCQKAEAGVESCQTQKGNLSRELNLTTEALEKLRKRGEERKRLALVKCAKSLHEMLDCCDKGRDHAIGQSIALDVCIRDKKVATAKVSAELRRGVFKGSTEDIPLGNTTKVSTRKKMSSCMQLLKKARKLV